MGKADFGTLPIMQGVGHTFTIASRPLVASICPVIRGDHFNGLALPDFIGENSA